MRLSMRRMSAMTAAQAASPWSGSSAHSCTYTRVPMIASSRSSQAADAGSGRAALKSKATRAYRVRVLMARQRTTSAMRRAARRLRQTGKRSRRADESFRSPAPFRPGSLLEYSGAPKIKRCPKGELQMNVAKLNGLICGAFLSAVLLAAPAITLAQDASAPLPVCKDGTTATKAGRGACKGHGGVNKDAGASTATPAASAAAAPAAATKGSGSSSGPVTCKDGTTSDKGGRGACRGHGGVNKSAGGAAGAAAAAAPAVAAKAPAAAAAAAPAAAAATTKSSGPAASVAAAPGGGAGQVWLNTKDNVYHCQGDEWYGKTKAGAYMTQAAAQAKGARAARGKACS